MLASKHGLRELRPLLKTPNTNNLMYGKISNLHASHRTGHNSYPNPNSLNVVVNPNILYLGTKPRLQYFSHSNPNKLMYEKISNFHTSHNQHSLKGNMVIFKRYKVYYPIKNSEFPMKEESKRWTTDTITNLLNTWADMLKTKDPEKVDSLYTENAHLNATFENETLTIPEERITYFKKFLQKDPKCKIITQHYNEGQNVVSGTYLFETKDGESVEARYTYVFNDAGKIIAHHSSIFPNEK